MSSHYSVNMEFHGFFFEENSKRFVIIFIRRRKIKRYKHTFNPTQLKPFEPTVDCKKENKELLVKKDQKNTSKTTK